MSPSLSLEASTFDLVPFNDPALFTSKHCKVQVRMQHSNAFTTGSSSSSSETSSRVLAGNITKQWSIQTASSVLCGNGLYKRSIQFRVTSKSASPATSTFLMNGVPLVFLNEKDATGGYQIVVLAADTLSVKKHVQFDTFNIGTTAQDQMVSFISSIDDRDMVGISVKENGGSSRSDLISALKTFGKYSSEGASIANGAL